MRRNLNLSTPRGRICGTASTGTKGSLIPLAGAQGPGFVYRYLGFPADNDAEFSGYINSLPAGVTFVAQENSSFLATGPDGVHEMPIELRRDGLLQFTTTFSLVFGSTPATVVSTVGNVVATGVSASITQGGPVTVTVPTAVGNAVAGGLLAQVSQLSQLTISATVGSAAASGRLGQITQNGQTTISAVIGSAVASGSTASISGVVTLTLTQADINAIADAVWAHPATDYLLTVARFLALK